MSWISRTFCAGILVLIGVAFLTSFTGGSDGAYSLGYHGLSWTPPLILDVIALIAVLVHFRVTADRKMRRLAAKFVLGPMLLSWGMQAIAHVQVAERPAVFDPTLWTSAVATYAGIGAVGVAALLYFHQRYTDYESRGTLAEAGDALSAVATVSPDVPVASSALTLETARDEVTATAVLSRGSREGAEPPGSTHSEAGRGEGAGDGDSTSLTLDAHAQRVLADNPRIGRSGLADELGCSEHQARTLLARHKPLRVAS